MLLTVSSVVSTGIIRIFGECVAEGLLVATSTECQGQGYFQVLFSCIENLLRSLNVRNLVLPAADEAESLWTNKFGFKKIMEDECEKEYHVGFLKEHEMEDLKELPEGKWFCCREEGKTGEGLKSDLVGKLEKKMPKMLKKYPTKLRELLETGLLEGLPVRYLRGVKTRGPSDTGLRGIIIGSGILCSCDSCGGTQVVTPNQFELHAGSGNKRPPECIYLDNGNTLRDVLNACRDAPLDSLQVNIQNVIGCSVQNKMTFCMNCKGYTSDSGCSRTVLLCKSCMILAESQSSPAPSSVNRERGESI